MGVVVNRPSEYTLGEVFQQMGIDSEDAALCAQPVLAGGPVHPERGFVLHDGDAGNGIRAWRSPTACASPPRATSSKRWRAARAREHAAVALGCAGWGAGQLEHELVENSWLTAPVDAGLLFALPLDARWQAAAGAHRRRHGAHGRLQRTCLSRRARRPSAADGTVLGFDVGARRIGVAVGSAFGHGARALAVVDVHGHRPDWPAIDRLQPGMAARTASSSAIR